MQKNFEKWNKRKIVIDNVKGSALFHEREIWWCSLGVNVGYEQDGGQKDFARPVVIIKKFNLDACLVIPLTSKSREGKYYFPLGKIKEREAVAVLSQIRFIDRRRLEEKICTLSKTVFIELVEKVVQISFRGGPP